MKAPMNSSARPPLRLFGGRIPSGLQLLAEDTVLLGKGHPHQYRRSRAGAPRRQRAKD